MMVSQDDKRMNPDDDGKCYLGLCDYKKATIRIMKDMTYEVTRMTVIHEVVHCFLFSYGINVEDNESMCDFFGAHGDEIISTTNKIMKGVTASVKE